MSLTLPPLQVPSNTPLKRLSLGSQSPLSFQPRPQQQLHDESRYFAKEKVKIGVSDVQQQQQKQWRGSGEGGEGGGRMSGLGGELSPKVLAMQKNVTVRRSPKVASPLSAPVTTTSTLKRRHSPSKIQELQDFTIGEIFLR